jgi:hypothetical protein
MAAIGPSLAACTGGVSHEKWVGKYSLTVCRGDLSHEMYFGPDDPNDPGLNKRAHQMVGRGLTLTIQSDPFSKDKDQPLRVSFDDGATWSSDVAFTKDTLTAEQVIEGESGFFSTTLSRRIAARVSRGRDSVRVEEINLIGFDPKTKEIRKKEDLVASGNAWWAELQSGVKTMLQNVESAKVEIPAEQQKRIDDLRRVTEIKFPGLCFESISA